MDHTAISLELLREDHAALESKMEKILKEKQDILAKQQELERQAKYLSEENRVLQAKLAKDADKEQIPPSNHANMETPVENGVLKAQTLLVDAQMKAENEKLRVEKENLERNVLHLRNDLERVYKRFKDQKAPSKSNDDMEVAKLLEQQSAWETQQLVVQELLQQCKDKISMQHLQKRRRLDDECAVHEQMLRDVIAHFKVEFSERQEFDQVEAQILKEQADSHALKQLMQEKELLEKDLLNYKETCASLESDIKKGHTYVLSLQEELRREKTQMEQMSAANNSEMERLAASLKEKCDALEILQAELQDAKKKRRDEDQDALSEYQHQIDQLRERVAAKEQYLLAQKEDTLAVLKKQADERLEREAAEAEYQMEIQLLKQSIDDLKARLEDSENQVTSLTKQLVDLASQLVRKEEELAGAQDKYNATLAKLNEEFQATKQLDDDKNNAAQAQLQDIQLQLSAKENQLKQLQEELKTPGFPPSTLPPFDANTSQELRDYFLAYYDCAETKLRSALLENEHKDGRIRQVEALLRSQVLPLAEKQEGELYQVITSAMQLLGSTTS